MKLAALLHTFVFSVAAIGALCAIMSVCILSLWLKSAWRVLRGLIQPKRSGFPVRRLRR